MKHENESLLKQKAIDFFLKDEGLQIYLGITTYVRCFLDPAPEEDHDHFSVCIETKLIYEHIGGHSVYDLFGIYIFDLDNSIVKDIAVRFYFFLSNEIITYNNLQIIQNKRILSLLSYSVGLH